MSDEQPQGADVFNFLDDDSFTTPPVLSDKHPEGGRRYVVPSPSAKVGMRLSALAEIIAKREMKAEISESDVARLQLDDAQERDHYRDVLGSAYQEMVDDGVSHVRIQRLAQFAFIYWTAGQAQAEDAARRGAFSGGAAFSPNRAARRGQTTTQSAPQVSAGSRKRRRR